MFRNPVQDQLQQTLGRSTTMPVEPRFEGFDFQRAQNPQKSAKDAFADLARKAPAAPLNDKSALGAWFTQNIQPGMDALGHKVSQVDGDKFRYANHEGDFWVDYGRGAGGDDGALAWQADPANGGAGVSGMAGLQMPGQQSDLMAQILAALQQPQSVDPQALLQQQLR